MDSDNKTLSFSVACKRYFGFLPGQTAGQFVKELKQLTDSDREEMAPLIAKEMGLPVSNSSN